MIALSGVRSSCDMFARNSDLCWLATSSCRLLSWISRNSRAFWMAMTAWSAKVRSSAMSLSEKGPRSLAADADRAESLALPQHRRDDHGPGTPMMLRRERLRRDTGS